MAGSRGHGQGERSEPVCFGGVEASLGHPRWRLCKNAIGITVTRHPVYKIKGIRHSPFQGITKPGLCNVLGVIKFDGEESHHCVYNEAVCSRLAQTLHAPIADGVLTMTIGGPAFVSLRLDSLGENLPDLLWKKRGSAARRYPDEVASLMLFDLLVGNWDRERNLKVSLANAHMRLFRAFDHSHALLDVYFDDMRRSLSALHDGELIVRRHPFYGLIPPQALSAALNRFLSVEDDMVRACCLFGTGFAGVSHKIQLAVADTLLKRRRLLEKIIRDNEGIINTLSADP
jgi:hypothetical protein